VKESCLKEACWLSLVSFFDEPKIDVAIYKLVDSLVVVQAVVDLMCTTVCA
jgi:hypothetical protein